MDDTQSPEIGEINTKIADLRANKELPRDEIGRQMERLYRDKQNLIDQQRQRDRRWQSQAAQFLFKLARQSN